MNSFTIDGYRFLIQSFIDAGYSFRFFSDGFSQEKVVYLRHDIDFSLRYALPIAKEEKELKVQSTYFIQMDSTLYNPFDMNNKQLIDDIHKMGHQICLHIDETKVTNAFTFEQYTTAFKVFFPYANTNIISRHRPNPDIPISWINEQVIDVYSKTYFKDIEYASDSRGEWRYGYPLDRPFFKSQKSIQLLTHPLWWYGSGSSKERVKNWLLEEELFRIQSNEFIKNLM